MAKKARTPHRLRQIEKLTTRRVAIYIRRSTDEDNQPYSLEVQETKLRAFVTSQPGEWVIVKIYSDDASGATTEREDLQKMLRAARTGLFDTLLVYRVDRFSRRVRDLVWLLDELADADVVFLSATEPFDTSTPAGRMLVQMLGVFAEFEREIIMDRVIGGMERKAAKGLWTQGRPGFGYRLDSETSNLTIVASEAPTVQLIFDLYTKDRLGTRSIARALNDRGLLTRSGKPWSQRTVETVLCNRNYIGEKNFRGIRVIESHDAIITTKQFTQAQNILQARSEEVGQRAANGSDYTLTGKIRCPRCGSTYIGTAAHGRNNRYRYYMCWTRGRYGAQHGCDLYRFNADELERAIGDALLNFYTDQRDLITQGIGEFVTAFSNSTSTHHDELATIKKELKANSAAIDRYLSAFERGHLNDDDPEIRHRLDNLRQQAKALRSRKAQLEFDLELPPVMVRQQDLDRISQCIRAILANNDTKTTKTLFEALIEEIEVQSDGSVIPKFKVPASHLSDKTSVEDQLILVQGETDQHLSRMSAETTELARVHAITAGSVTVKPVRQRKV